MGFTSKVSGTLLVITILIICLLLVASIINKLKPTTTPPTSNVTPSGSTTLATPGSATGGPTDETPGGNKWLQLILMLATLFATEIGDRLQKMVEEAEERKKAREAENAAVDDANKRRIIDNQKPPREDIEDKIRKLQDESEKKVRSKVDEDARANDLKPERAVIDPDELEERVKKARDASEKVIREEADLEQRLKDVDKVYEKPGVVREEVDERLKNVQDASERLVRSRAELDTLTGDIDKKRFSKTSEEYLRDRIEKSRIDSERYVKARRELDTVLGEVRDINVRIGTEEFKSYVDRLQKATEDLIKGRAELLTEDAQLRTIEGTVIESETLKEKIKKVSDLSERYVEARADYNSTLGKIRTIDILPGSDELKPYADRLRDAKERLVEAQSELDAETGRPARVAIGIESETVRKNFKDSADLHERFVEARAEYNSTLREIQTIDIPPGSEELKSYADRLRDAKERLVEAQSELDAETGRPTRASTGIESETVRKNFKDSADLHERFVEARAEYNSVLGEIRTVKAPIGSEELKSYADRLRDARERLVEVESEIAAETSQPTRVGIEIESEMVQKKIRNSADLHERYVEARAEYNSVLGEIRASSVPLGPDELKSYANRLRDARERLIEVQYELDTETNQPTRVGVDIENETIRKKFRDSIDLHERFIEARLEYDTALGEIRTINVPIGSDEFKAQMDRVQNATERLIETRTELDTENVENLARQTGVDRETLREKFKDSANVHERLIEARAEYDSALNQLRTIEVPIGSDEFKARMDRFNNATERLIEARTELNTETSQIRAFNLEGVMLAEGEYVKEKFKKTMYLHERYIEARTEYNSILGEIRAVDILPGSDELKPYADRLRDARERLVETLHEFETEAGQFRTFDMEGTLLNDIREKFREYADFHERFIEARAEYDSARKQLRTIDVPIGPDEFKARMDRFQKATEKIIEARSELGAEKLQELASRTVAGNEMVQKKIRDSMDVHERYVEARTEYNTATEQLRTINFSTGPEDLKAQLDRFQKATEKLLEVRSELETMTRQDIIARRTFVEGDFVKGQFKNYREFKEHQFKYSTSLVSTLNMIVPSIERDYIKKVLGDIKALGEIYIEAKENINALDNTIRQGTLDILVEEVESIENRIKTRNEMLMREKEHLRTIYAESQSIYDKIITNENELRRIISEGRDLKEKYKNAELRLSSTIEESRIRLLSLKNVYTDDLKRLEKLESSAREHLRKAIEAESANRVKYYEKLNIPNEENRAYLEREKLFRESTSRAKASLEQKQLAITTRTEAYDEQVRRINNKILDDMEKANTSRTAYETIKKDRDNVKNLKEELIANYDEIGNKLRKFTSEHEARAKAEISPIDQEFMNEYKRHLTVQTEELYRLLEERRTSIEAMERAQSTLDTTISPIPENATSEEIKRILDADIKKLEIEFSERVNIGKEPARIFPDNESVTIKLRDIERQLDNLVKSRESSKPVSRREALFQLAENEETGGFLTRAQLLLEETKKGMENEKTKSLSRRGALLQAAENEETGNLLVRAQSLLEESKKGIENEKEKSRLTVQAKPELEDTAKRIKNYGLNKTRDLINKLNILDLETSHGLSTSPEEIRMNEQRVAELKRIRHELELVEKKLTRTDVVTSDVIMHVIVEENGVKRLKKQDGSYFSLKELLERFPGQAKLALNTTYMSAFGRVVSYPFRITNEGVEILGNLMKAIIAKTGISRVGAVLGESKLGKWANSITEAMVASKILRKGAGAIDILMGPTMDMLQIAMTFSDSAFAGLFPDTSTLISSQTLKNIATKGVKIQLDGFRNYNINIQASNNNLEQGKYPDTYAQYPMVAGPLSDLGMKGDDADSRDFRGDPFYNQLRIQTAVDAIREKILRDPNQTFKGVSFQSFIIAKYGPSGFNNIVNDPEDSLISYVDALPFSADFVDELYFRAYSNVCAYYGGKVYEDNYIMGHAGLTTAFCPRKSDGTLDKSCVKNTRRRFQCGYIDQVQCTLHSRRWLAQDESAGQVMYGSYAEWFTQDDINKLILTDPDDPNQKMMDNSDPDHAAAPLYIQDAFLQGACIVTTSGAASLCQQGKGQYDPQKHLCIFTPEYCQSIGTCYCNQDGGSCFLPTDTMDALAFFFGTGGVREWIKINGCHSSSCNPSSPIEYSQLSTTGGQQWFSDMFANSKNWGPALKQSLGTPAGAMMFVGAVLGLAIPIQAAATASIAATASAAAISAATASGATAAAAEEAGVVAAELVLASSVDLGPAALLVAIGAGVAMMVEMGAAHYKELTAPTTDEAEYTLGGWNIISRSDGTKYVSPKKMSFTNGWVTYPILYHPPNKRFEPYPNVDAFGFGPMYFFDTTFEWNTTAHPCTNDHGPSMRACIEFYQGMNIGQQTCYQNWKNVGSPSNPKNFHGPPRWIRGASDGSSDQIWCLPPFPVNDGSAGDGSFDTTGLFDPLIGSAALITSASLTNNTWTNGQDMTYPEYPISSAAKGGTSPDTQKWYYQLVYDELDVCKSQYLWSTPYLQKYFTDQTITNMRKTCCNHAYLDDLSGQSVDPKCWGYMAVKFQSWNFKPTTVVPETATPLKTISYTPRPTQCPAGSYIDLVQNKCMSCPAGMYSTAGMNTCYWCGAGATLVGNTGCTCPSARGYNRQTVNGVTSCIANTGTGTGTGNGNPTSLPGGHSDVRLKTNMRKTGRFIKGFTEYTWEWNDEARRIGASSSPTTGLIAQEVRNFYPDAVITDRYGYYLIDYNRMI